MNPGDRSYFSCKRKGLAFVFGLRNSSYYLLSRQIFELVTAHESLKDAFLRNKICRRLAFCFKLLAEYDCVIRYWSGKMNSSTDGLSQLEVEAEVRTKDDEGDLLLSVFMRKGAKAPRRREEAPLKSPTSQLGIRYYFHLPGSQLSFAWILLLRSVWNNSVKESVLSASFNAWPGQAPSQSRSALT